MELVLILILILIATNLVVIQTVAHDQKEKVCQWLLTPKASTHGPRGSVLERREGLVCLESAGEVLGGLGVEIVTG